MAMSSFSLVKAMSANPPTFPSGGVAKGSEAISSELRSILKIFNKQDKGKKKSMKNLQKEDVEREGRGRKRKGESRPTLS